uniref:DnaJ (Hsp40) homolog, subfamily C, member 4 n=1 Tax=Gadus morhua TaxID=8049 RepID=A0A8C5AS09_GADMO
MQFEAQLSLCRRCLWSYRSGLRMLSLSSANRYSVVSYYELLGVKPTATLEEIKHAFFAKSKEVHPDRDPSNPALHSQFVELSEAYRVLGRERSRKEYDFKLRTPYRGARCVCVCVHLHTLQHNTPTGSHDNTRYWEQFTQSQAQEVTPEEWERKRRRNFRLVGYCLLTMLLSVVVLYFPLFRKLEEMHSNFMDEKDRNITEIYNQSKERARVNGFKKQTEILRQKHAEFVEKYNLPNVDGGEEK